MDDLFDAVGEIVSAPFEIGGEIIDGIFGEI